MDERTQRLSDAFEIHGRLTTFPVAIRLAKEGEKMPGKVKYPRADIGNRLAACQGMSIARNLGWAMAFGANDHACPMPRVFMGHASPERFLTGLIADFYQDEASCMESMESSYPRWPEGRYQEIWFAPIQKCAFIPDLVVAYGSPAQILSFVHGANFRLGPGITSVSTGRYGCATWIAGVIQADACTYMIPGPGERIFAGTQDYEMSFAIPYSKFDTFVEGMNYVRSRGAYKYPVPNLGLLSEPKIPKKYQEIDSD
jgi:uncharacterized protein (DUF169 family)